MEFYVFETEAEAIKAEATISLLGSTPITGKNAKTGKEDPSKQKTERWAIPYQRLTDGKWIFAKVPDRILAQYPEDTIKGFNDSFSYTLEEFDPKWFPEDIIE